MFVTDPDTIVPNPSRSVFEFDGAALSHKGFVREHNEDATLADPGRGLWVVADGMGGYDHGSLASNLTIQALSDYRPSSDPKVGLDTALHEANERILSTARSIGTHRMGATVVVIALSKASATIGWAGDARAYVLRSTQLHQITHDHTVVQNLVDIGQLDPAAVSQHPDAHVVTRGLGVATEVKVDYQTIGLQSGDRLLACSDGLTGQVPEVEIRHALGSTATADEACRLLVATALDRGAHDNISVIVIDIKARRQ